MMSAERAARLSLVVDEEADRIRKEEHAAAAARKHGAWRWRFVGGEIQLRARSLPMLRLDMLRTEARDLMTAIGKALNEPVPKTPRITATQRKADKRTRKASDKAQAIERSYALKQLAEEFAASGGW